MAKKNYNEADEMVHTELDTETTPSVDLKIPKKTYIMKDGSQGSRAAFIREQFTTELKSRQQIAEEFNFKYHDVYTATVNMDNGTESTGRGRTPQNTTIDVDINNRVITSTISAETGEIYEIYANGELLDAMPETTTVNRNDWIRNVVENGASRGDVSKWLNLSYGVIYGLTKDLAGTSNRTMYQLEDGSEVTRSEYIRILFASGMTKSEIAETLGVDYPIVWQATKQKKSEAEKFLAAINNVSDFAESVTEDTLELFNNAIDLLRAVQIKTPETAEATETSDMDVTETAENN